MRKTFFNTLPILAAILLALACPETMGQVIYGGIFNSVTRQRISNVKVELMDKHYVTLDSMRNPKNNRIADRTDSRTADCLAGQTDGQPDNQPDDRLNSQTAK